MKDRTRYSIAIVTALVFVYVVCANLPVAFGLVFILFLGAAAGLLWMVYSILTDTKSLSGKTFDDYFYEDVDDRRSKD